MAWRNNNPAIQTKSSYVAPKDPSRPVSSTNPVWPTIINRSASTYKPTSTDHASHCQNHGQGRRDSRFNVSASKLYAAVVNSTSFVARAREYQASIISQPHFRRPYGKVTLLALPLSLRQKIWTKATCATQLLRVPPYFPTPEAYPSLFGVSKQVHQEATAAFYEGNRFCLVFGHESSQAILEEWLYKVGRGNITKLRHLVFLRRDCGFKLDVELQTSTTSAAMVFMPMVPATAGEEAKLLADLEPLLPRRGGFDVEGFKRFFGTLHHRQWEKKGAQLVVRRVEAGEGIVGDDGDE